MARLTYFLILCVLIPSLLAQCTNEKVKPLFGRSVYEFSIKLSSRIAQEKENHFITSTFSTWTLLTSVSLGAADATLAELKKVLKLKTNKCYNNEYLKLANFVAYSNTSEVVVQRSSNIYVDYSLEILDTFKDRIAKAELSKFESLSFEDPDLATQVINDYASRATHETIDEVVTPGDLEDVIMIIIDAIYFKGSWQIPFNTEETNVSPFYNERGIQIGEVNMMHLTDSFNYRLIEQLNALAIELPYGEDKRYSMLIFLPLKNVPLYTVMKKLKKISLKTLNVLFDEFGPLSVSVQLPRFKITSDISNLKELLVDMGLKTMFDSTQARFPLISDYSLYVSNFIQKADISVTEEGTVASAVTKAQFGYRTIPENFIANRPFLFMIINKEVGVPLFTGAYSKPSLY